MMTDEFDIPDYATDSHIAQHGHSVGPTSQLQTPSEMAGMKEQRDFDHDGESEHGMTFRESKTSRFG